MLNELNCYNLKVWELSVTLKTFEVKVKIGKYFTGVKCNFPFFLYSYTLFFHRLIKSHYKRIQHDVSNAFPLIPWIGLGRKEDFICYS
jgi:hypothetical protein